MRYMMKKILIGLLLPTIILLSACTQGLEAKVMNNSQDKKVVQEQDNKDTQKNSEDEKTVEENISNDNEIDDKDEITVNEEGLKIIKPTIGYIPDLSKEAEEKWNKGKEIYHRIYDDKIDEEQIEELPKEEQKEEFRRLMEEEQQEQLRKLTEEERALMNYYDQRIAGFWHSIGAGCSWYCGGRLEKVKASSNLKGASKLSYVPGNAHDFDLRAAWVEGAKGHGIGEYIQYHFEPLSPRVNKVKVFNGYIKSKDLWKSNSRVKKFKLYINNNPYAILELEDTSALQEFEIEPVRSEIEGEDLVLKFEILDVYKGDKYEDTAISEINFSGLDVHCFVKGTMIKMGDGSEKPIEELKENDEVLSYNFEKDKIEKSKIQGLAKARHGGLVKLDFGKLQIISTDDHPYFTMQQGWSSLKPEKSKVYKGFQSIGLLKVGDDVISIDKDNQISAAKLLKIEEIERCQETYTITKLDKNNCFFANGLLVGAEEINLQFFKEKLEM